MSKIWPCVLASLALSAAELPAQDAANETRRRVLDRLVAESPIIFRGTVLDVGGASFADVPREEPTVVLRTDEVYVTPKGYALNAGQRITVAVRDLNLLKRGVVAVVYAKPWLTGVGQAVRTVGHELLPASPDEKGSTLIRSEIHEALERLVETRLTARLATADLVFAGEVTEVRDAAPPAGRPRRISEHDPQWKEAIVRVDEGLRGVAAGESVVVRFPTSNDVMWKNAPRFALGATPILFLDVDRRSGAALTSNVDNQPKPVYAASKRDDVVSRDELARIRRLLDR